MNGDTILAGFFPATAMPDGDWWEALWPHPGQVLADLGVTPGTDMAVDLCCGDGMFTAPLIPLARHLVAIDIDPRLLALARDKVAALIGGGDCKFIEGDAYDVARLVQRAADVVLIANTFHGVPDKTRLAYSIAATLKPDGRLIVVNWHRRPREETTVFGQPRGPRTDMRMEPVEVARAVKPAGLHLARIVELPPYHYGAIFEKRVS
jgi:SAM-dependent methyltransferase